MGALGLKIIGLVVLAVVVVVGIFWLMSDQPIAQQSEGKQPVGPAESIRAQFS